MLRRAAALISLIVTAVLFAGPPSAASERTATTGDYVFEKEWAFGSQTERIYGMDVSPSGEVFAVGNRVNQYQSTVRRYDADGTLTHSWALPFNNPGDLAVDAAGNVHISDYFGDSLSGRPAAVVVYSRDGAVVRTYARSQDWADASLGAIAVDPAGNSYVTDPVEDLVYKFAPDGTHLLDFGGSGVAPGQFDSPRGCRGGS